MSFSKSFSISSSSCSKIPRAVLFDYDGVLVSSESIHLRSWMQLLDELGLPKEVSVIQEYAGQAAPYIIRSLLDRYLLDWDPKKYNIEKLAQRKNLFFLSLAQKQLVCYPGVLQGLKALRGQGILTAVVSNLRTPTLERTMKDLGLFEWMDFIVGREDARACKPDPFPYFLAAAALKIPVEECLAVEDSPIGLESALKASISAAAIMTSFSREVLVNPVLGRADLKPVWIGPSLIAFFHWLGFSEIASS